MMDFLRRRKYCVGKILLFVLIAGLPACSTQLKKTKPVSTAGKPKTRPDNLPEKRIILAYSKAGEKEDLSYFHDGKYDPKAMRAINRIMRDRNADETGEIDPELIDFLVDIRTRLALPPTIVFEVLSGYRSKDSNEELAKTNGNVAKDSLHMYGWAIDFRVDGVNGNAMAEVAKTMQRGGVSYYPSDNHVHVDLGNIRTWPTKGK